MRDKLWQVRVKAFFVQFGSMIVVALGTVIMSPQFKDLITAHFGTSFVAGAALLLITGTVSHILNKIAVKKLGAGNEDNEAVLI